MFNKLKTKIRLKLRLFLGINSLEENFVNYENENDKHITRHDNEISTHEYLINKNSKMINQFDGKVETIHNTVENVVHIGTDVRPHSSSREHSWAVVCIEGKMNIVKFVDLNRQDGRDVLNFLKQFEAGRHCIDAPCQEMFYEGLWKF